MGKAEMITLARERGVAFAAYQYSVKQSTIERYLREAHVDALPAGQAVSRGLLITDIHLAHDEEEHQAYSLVKQFAGDWGPDWVVNLGDWHDFGYLSDFDGEMEREGMRLEKDAELGNRDLDWWQSKTRHYTLLQGNHDERLDRFVARAPAFEWMVNAEKLFKFKERGIDYYPVREQPYKKGKLNMIHGWFANQYHTKKHLDRLSGNVVYGHVHEFQTHSKNLAAFGEEIAAWSLGCLCDKVPSYAKGRPVNWQNGFGIVYMDEYGSFNLYPVRMINGSFLWEGERHSLKELSRSVA